MFLLDSLLMAPGKAVLFLFEELAKKAQEEFLDDDTVKQELQEIYALLESGKISQPEFEAREVRLVQRLQQIARAKLQEIGAAQIDMAMPLALPPVTAQEDEYRPAIDGVVTEAYDTPPMDVGPAVDLLPLPAIEPIPAAPSPTPAEAPAAEATPAPVAVHSAAPPAATATAPPLAANPAPVVVPSLPPVHLTMGQVIDSATRGLSMLKLKVSSITSVARAGNGWHVTAELVERRGVPDTSDLLGVYEMDLDEGGHIVRYERTRMRRRCDLSR